MLDIHSRIRFSGSFQWALGQDNCWVMRLHVAKRVEIKFPMELGPSALQPPSPQEKYLQINDSPLLECTKAFPPHSSCLYYPSLQLHQDQVLLNIQNKISCPILPWGRLEFGGAMLFIFFSVWFNCFPWLNLPWNASLFIPTLPFLPLFLLRNRQVKDNGLRNKRNIPILFPSFIPWHFKQTFSELLFQNFPWHILVNIWF